MYQYKHPLKTHGESNSTEKVNSGICTEGKLEGQGITEPLKASQKLDR